MTEGNLLGGVAGLGGMMGTIIGHYLAPVGISFLFEIGGGVVGIFAAAGI
jgi:hypothetical protein